jgi:hypothetical protein
LRLLTDSQIDLIIVLLHTFLLPQHHFNLILMMGSVKRFLFKNYFKPIGWFIINMKTITHQKNIDAA